MPDWDYDAIVVGAGPAGTAAAVSLARSGRHVALIDKAAFPRDKPCGDLIGTRALALARRLGIDEDRLSPYEPLAGAYLTSSRTSLDLVPGGRIGRRLLRSTDARVIPRTVFDAAMVEAAVLAGADLLRVSVQQIGSWDEAGRSVTGRAGEAYWHARAPIVILAGGYGSRVLLGRSEPEPGQEPPRGIAMRAYFSSVDAPPNRIAFCLDDWLLPGYGWVFPLPYGGANVGVGTLVKDGTGTEHLRDIFARFTADERSPSAEWLRNAACEGKPRSWPIDLGPRRRTLVETGLLVAGEAAALVGPLTGAGIAFALASGIEAAEAADRALTAGDCSEQALGVYGRRISRRFGVWLRTEETAQRFLSSPQRTGWLFSLVNPLPPTGAVGARLLLHLG